MHGSEEGKARGASERGSKHTTHTQHFLNTTNTLNTNTYTKTTQAYTLEVERLADDNALLANRLEQMQLDLRELLATGSASGLGHANPRQKIQYHLKLKQELEELRHECTLLLREKFSLEQCVRYLAVRARVPLALEANASGTGERGALEKVQPGSLAPSVLFSTPLAQRSMRLSGRGRGAEDGTVYGSGGKEAFEAGADAARRRTAEELQRWANAGGGEGGSGGGVGDDTHHYTHDQPGAAAGTPPRGGSASKARRSSAGGGHADGAADAFGTPGAPPSGGGGGAAAAGATVEARILAKVVQVVSPAPPAASRIFARRAAVTTRPDAAAHGLDRVESAAPPVGSPTGSERSHGAHGHGGGGAMAALEKAVGKGPGALRRSVGIAGSRPAVVRR